jgi:hypothetical protein
MAKNSVPSDTLIRCLSCGEKQDSSLALCTKCGAPLNAPGLIYQRQPDGTWTILRGIDLSSLAPKPPRLKERIFSRVGFIIIAALAVIVVLVVLRIWSNHTRGVEAMVREVDQYAAHPVGRIYPSFQVQAQEDPQKNLRVSGTCNLPNATQLDIRVFSNGTLVAVDYPVVVIGGRFSSRQLLDRGRPFSPGNFQIQVKADFASRWQPQSVLDVVGDLGQRLQGSLVQRADSTSSATVIYRQNITL